jgi:hypothetical protein
MGELIQIDGSEHWWFEARGPQCTLLVYIDDATSDLIMTDDRLDLTKGEAEVAVRTLGEVILAR